MRRRLTQLSSVFVLSFCINKVSKDRPHWRSKFSRWYCWTISSKVTSNRFLRPNTEKMNRRLKFIKATRDFLASDRLSKVRPTDGSVNASPFAPKSWLAGRPKREDVILSRSKTGRSSSSTMEDSDGFLGPSHQVLSMFRPLWRWLSPNSISPRRNSIEIKRRHAAAVTRTELGSVDSLLTRELVALLYSNTPKRRAVPERLSVSASVSIPHVAYCSWREPTAAMAWRMAGSEWLSWSRQFQKLSGKYPGNCWAVWQRKKSRARRSSLDPVSVVTVRVVTAEVLWSGDCCLVGEVLVNSLAEVAATA